MELKKENIVNAYMAGDNSVKETSFKDIAMFSVGLADAIIEELKEGKKMKQITVQFFRPKSIFDTALERVTIKTGKVIITEAFEVACNNGHDPNKNIRFITE